MKPNELLDYCREEQYAQAETKRSITNYINKDCVVAYDKNKIGVIFIIKSKKSHFGYVALKNNIYLGGHGYDFRKLKLNLIVSLLGNDCNILNKEEFSKIKKKMIVDNL